MGRGSLVEWRCQYRAFEPKNDVIFELVGRYPKISLGLRMAASGMVVGIGISFVVKELKDRAPRV